MSSTIEYLVDSKISFGEIIELRKFGNELLNCKTLDEVLKNLFEKIHLTICPQVSSVFLYSKDGYIQRVGILGSDKNRNPIDNSWFEEEKYKPGESFSGKVIKPLNPSTEIYGTSIFCKDIQKEYQSLKYKEKYLDKLGQLKEGISVPLNGTHRTFGTIEVLNKLNNEGELDSKTALTKEDLCWLTVVGSHVSAAISRLRKAEEDNIVALITRELVEQNLSEDRVNDNVTKEVAELLIFSKLMPYKACIIRKLSKDGKTLQVDANVSISDINQKPNSQRFINDKKGIIQEIASLKKSIKIKRIEDNLEKFKSQEWISKNNLKSFFGFPFLIQGKAVGTIALFTGYEYELDENEENFINNITCLLAAYRVGVRTLSDNRKYGVIPIHASSESYWNEINERNEIKLKNSIHDLVSQKENINSKLLINAIQFIVCTLTVVFIVYLIIFLGLSPSYVKLLSLFLIFVSFLTYKLLLKIITILTTRSQIKELIKRGALLEKQV